SARASHIRYRGRLPPGRPPRSRPHSTVGRVRPPRPRSIAPRTLGPCGPGVRDRGPGSQGRRHEFRRGHLARLPSRPARSDGAPLPDRERRGKYLTTNGSSLSWATVSAGVSSVFGRTGAVVATTGDYTAAQVTNAVSTASSYADPAWITSLAGSKITGNITGNAASITGSITESQVTNLV